MFLGPRAFVDMDAIQWWHVLMQGFQGMDPGRALVPYSSDWVADEVLYL